MRITLGNMLPPDPEPYLGPVLSSGSTLLNLAMSDSPFGAFVPGKYYFLVGDSTSGKTWFSLTCFAEAMLDPAFRDYRLIHDNPEDGALMDIKRFFGKAVAERIEQACSESVEDFYFNVDDALEGKPCIYVLDSMDALDAKDDAKHFEAMKKASRAGNKDPGTYGMAKAKANSTKLRRIVNKLSRTKSILIIIGQTRENVGAGMFEPKKTRGGGKALRFYATCEIWTSVGKALKVEVNKKKRSQGSVINLQMKKNRITGKLRQVQTVIYPSYGIDDTGSVIDWLLEEGWWSKNRGVISADEFKVELKRADLIKHIEAQPRRVRRLRKTAGKCWDNIEEALRVDRPARY